MRENCEIVMRLIINILLAAAAISFALCIADGIMTGIENFDVVLTPRQKMIEFRYMYLFLGFAVMFLLVAMKLESRED